ncbi:MAG: hypothetical protein ACI8PZ_002253 [Myxococcota bacterium]|jgi:hypothetical protein
MRAALLLLCTLLPALAVAVTPVEQAQQAELDRVRAQIADQVHLYAFDLVDELVWEWAQEPVFESPTPVVLAGVTVPVGLGTGLQALLENHLAASITHHPNTNVQLVHCPQCTAVVVHSGPDGTVVSRGFDDPAVLERLGVETGRHALFIDVEAEGAFLVLRARLTRLTPDLPIVWSHTLSTSASTPALLRESRNLKSAEDARAEYLGALTGRGPFQVPIRFAVRSYAPPQGGLGTPPPPFLWVQSGVELAGTEARAWTASLLIGYSFIPQAYQGLMGQTRIARLITGRHRSLTRPDLYLFLGGSVNSVWGPATASFQDERVTADQILAAAELEGPRTSFGAFQVGLDARVGNRIGVSTYLETIPTLADSRNLGRFLQFGFEWHCLGTEVAFWF